MASRLTFRQQEQTREAIRTTQLIKRLQHFALDEISDQGEVVNITPERLRAIEILLKKSLPDLSSVTLEGNPENPVEVAGKIELVAVSVKPTLPAFTKIEPWVTPEPQEQS